MLRNFIPYILCSFFKDIFCKRPERIQLLFRDIYVIYWSLIGRDSGFLKQGAVFFLKVNKREWKCQGNCVGGMLEGRVTTRCVSVRKRFQPLEQDDSEYTEKQRRRWAFTLEGQTILGWEVGKSLNVQNLIMSKASKISEQRRNEDD